MFKEKLYFVTFKEQGCLSGDDVVIDVVPCYGGGELTQCYENFVKKLELQGHKVEVRTTDKGEKTFRYGEKVVYAQAEVESELDALRAEKKALCDILSYIYRKYPISDKEYLNELGGENRLHIVKHCLNQYTWCQPYRVGKIIDTINKRSIEK